MTKINCQKGQSMSSLNPFLILMQLLFITLFLQNEVGADGTSRCGALLHPLASNVDEIKGQGGIWGMFDQSYKVRNHATVTLKLDSKITVLIVRLDYLCKTQNGVPLEEIAQILLPRLKTEGEKALTEDLLNLGHFEEEAKKLIAYAKFAESNLNRKLEFDQIAKTIMESQTFSNRLVEISKKIGEVESETVMAESKVLISDIEKFLMTNSYLVLADKESAEIPHSRYVTGDSDAM